MNTKTFEAIEKLKEVELELHRLKNALEMANKALDAQRTWVGLTDEQARTEFEAWHKSTYTQSLERYGHTYKNMHVRNRWQGWLAAHGIKGEA